MKASHKNNCLAVDSKNFESNYMKFISIIILKHKTLKWNLWHKRRLGRNYVFAYPSGVFCVDFACYMTANILIHCSIKPTGCVIDRSGEKGKRISEHAYLSNGTKIKPEILRFWWDGQSISVLIQGPALHFQLTPILKWHQSRSKIFWSGAKIVWKPGFIWKTLKWFRAKCNWIPLKIFWAYFLTNLGSANAFTSAHASHTK